MRFKAVPNHVKMNKPYISAIILAAGSSLRMKGKNKLLEKIGYNTMIQDIFLQTISSKVDNVTIVLGFESDKVLANLKSFINKPNVNIIKNKNFVKGLGVSLSVGVNSLPKKTTGVLIVLADMPKINTYIINKLINAPATPPEAAPSVLFAPSVTFATGCVIAFQDIVEASVSATSAL